MYLIDLTTTQPSCPWLLIESLDWLVIDYITKIGIYFMQIQDDNKFKNIFRPEYSWKIARWTLNTNQSINQSINQSKIY